MKQLCAAIVVLWLLPFSILAQQDTLRAQNLHFLLPSEFSKVMDHLKSRGQAMPRAEVTAMGYDSASGLLHVFSRGPSGTQEQTTVALALETFRSLFTMQHSPVSVPAAEKVKPDQSGRVYFIAHTALKSLYVYPSGFSEVFTHANGQVISGLALLAGGGALYGSYAYTKDRSLGYGRVAFMNYGGELGCIYPILAGVLLRNGTSIDRPKLRYDLMGNLEPGMDYERNISDKITALGSMIGFPLGIYAGSRVNFNGIDSYGKAALARDFSRWAFLYGYLLPLYGKGASEEDYFTAASGLTMALLPAGFYLGLKISQSREISPGRSFMVLTTGVMGALTGLFAPTLFESKAFDLNRRVYVTSTLAGQALGTWFGFCFKRSAEYSFGQGVFTALSATGGAAVALSVPLIAQSDDHRFYTAMAMAGGWSGLWVGEKLARSIFENSERDTPVLSRVTFPVLWQWPLLLASAGSGKSGLNPETPQTVELVRISF